MSNSESIDTEGNFDADLPQESKGRSQNDFLKDLRTDEDVSLQDLITPIWKGRYKLLLVSIFFLFFGIFHYATAPKEYVSYTKLLQESQNQQTGTDGLRLLGQIGGFNIAPGMGGQRGLSPELYPEIVESIDFQKELLLQPLEFSTLGQQLTLFEFFNYYYEEPFRTRFYRGIRNYTIRLPITLYQNMRGLFNRINATADSIPDQILENVTLTDREVLILTPEFRYARSQIDSRIDLEPEGAILRVETRLSDPMAASQFNIMIAEKMREYIVSYQNEKSRSNLQFVEKLHEESGTRYQQAQFDLAMFTDRNQGNLTATAALELERLQDYKDLTFQLYTSISQRLEEAKVRVQEDTPIFTTFQRPILPTEPESSSILIIPVFILFGVFLGVMWIFGEKTYLYFREQIKNIEA